MRGTKLTILTDHKPRETFIDRTEASEKLSQWQEFLVSVNQTIVHTAGQENLITDAIYRNYIRIDTSTGEEDFSPESIDNTTLHRTPTLPTPTNTITCNHLCIAPLTTDLSEYQSSASDFSDTDSEYNLCRSRGKAVGPHHTCLYQGDADCEHFVSYAEYNEFLKIIPPTEPQDTQSASLIPIDPAIIEGYTPVTVEHIRVEAYKADIVRMYQHYKQHQRDHCTNCTAEYCKTHYSSHLNRN